MNLHICNNPATYVMRLHNPGYLNLGDDEGPCKNTSDKSVRTLAKHYFKIRDLSSPKHYIRANVALEMEYMARLSEFGEIKSFDPEQLKKFPLRTSITKKESKRFGFWKRKVENRIDHQEFIDLSQGLLTSLHYISNGKARYAMIFDGETPNTDNVPEEQFFIYNCISHISPIFTEETSSLRELSKDRFEKVSSIQVGIRFQRKLPEERSEIALLDYNRRNANEVYIYSEGAEEFKLGLAERLQSMELPKGFSFFSKNMIF